VRLVASAESVPADTSLVVFVSEHQLKSNEAVHPLVPPLTPLQRQVCWCVATQRFASYPKRELQLQDFTGKAKTCTVFYHGTCALTSSDGGGLRCELSGIVCCVVLWGCAGFAGERRVCLVGLGPHPSNVTANALRAATNMAVDRLRSDSLCLVRLLWVLNAAHTPPVLCTVS
jgi:hypothetical protein